MDAILGEGVTEGTMCSWTGSPFYAFDVWAKTSSTQLKRIQKVDDLLRVVQ